MPERVQIVRRQGWRLPDDTVEVTWPGRWGNPFPTGPFMTAVQATARFRFALENGLPDVPTIDEVRQHLAGYDLACWCAIDQPCHAEVLLEVANRGLEDEASPQS